MALKKFLPKFDNYIFQISKKYFKNGNKDIIMCPTSKVFEKELWNINSIGYNYLVETNIVFSMQKLEHFETFYFFTNNFNNICKDFCNYLVKCNYQLGTIDNSNIIFIDEFCTNFLHLLYLYKLFEKNVRFYTIVISPDKKDDGFDLIKPIFVSGGVLTITLELYLKFFDIPQMRLLYDELKRSDLWVLKIPKLLFNKIKTDLESEKGILKFDDKKKLVDWFKECVEESEEALLIKDSLTFIKYCTKKYYKEKRFFFVLHTLNKGNYYKTPEEIYEKYIKSQGFD